MRVLIVCAEPDSAGSNPESVLAVLVDLGCRVKAVRFDFGDLDKVDFAAFPPDFVVFDAAEELERAQRARRKMSQIEELGELPSLLAVGLPRITALDFSIGFDDFVLCPLVPAELYARLRQLDWQTATFGSDEVVKVGDLVIDLAGYEARLSGRRLEFTHQEFELLKFLSQNRGRVYSRDQLLQKVWGYDYGGGTRTVDIHIRRVRAKLGTNMGALIETVRHVGYKMRGEGDSD